MDEEPISTTLGPGSAGQGQDTAEDKSGHAPEDVWDPDTWSGPAQTLLTLVALIASFVVWFIVVDHLPEAWADWAAIPVLGLGDMIAAALFVVVYGSVRTLLRPLLQRWSLPRQVGRHRCQPSRGASSSRRMTTRKSEIGLPKAPPAHDEPPTGAGGG